MELWIRSQKNEKLRFLLLKVNEIEIGDYDDDMDCIVVNNLHCVGIYKSKERVLEVLDEIQEYLDYLNIGNINRVDEKGFRVCTIYEMPEE
jgi:hypothetical protein